MARALDSAGGHYQNGNGVPRYDTTEVSWLQKAAERGDAEAQNKLGVCYFSGKGMDANEAPLLQVHARACSKGLLSHSLTEHSTFGRGGCGTRIPGKPVIVMLFVILQAPRQ